MSYRPALNKLLTSEEFKQYYYLKKELIGFSRQLGLSVSGSKMEIADRIYYFLETGEKKLVKHTKAKRPTTEKDITEESIIEEGFVCSETNRAFFKEKIGSSFSFLLGFQKWIKNNSGKTYKEAVDAYYKILEDNKKEKTIIGSQFEYNKYIRDFFEYNKGRSLNEAIVCWRYKKGLRGGNSYSREDLSVL